MISNVSEIFGSQENSLKYTHILNAKLNCWFQETCNSSVKYFMPNNVHFKDIRAEKSSLSETLLLGSISKKNMVL